jgi:cytochrome c oxidase subunit 1
MLGERLGQWQFWLFFIGFNLTFLPMHQLGLRGMTRRIYTYSENSGWTHLNQIASLGAVLMATSALLFLINVLRSRRHGAVAGSNPWDAPTLEWSVLSPPPAYSFVYPPTVRSLEPMWDGLTATPAVFGLSTTRREVLSTTVVEARPEHKHELPEDSLWPFLLSVVSGVSLAAVIFHPAALPIGLAAACPVLYLWFWRNNEVPALRLDRLRGLKSEEEKP